MAVTGVYTVQDACGAALDKIGVKTIGEAPTSEDYDLARAALSRMLKAWQNHGYSLWYNTEITVTLTTAASYTMSPVRPVRVNGVRFVSATGSEMPMQEMTRQEYLELPLKTSTGIPTSYYYDRQREAAKLYVWPVMASVTTETLKVDAEREADDMETQDDALDVPGEWFDAVVYGLAARIMDDYEVNRPSIQLRAEEELRLALSADREGSISFCGDQYAYS